MRSIVISLQVKGELPSFWHVICKSGPYQSTDTTEQILQTGIELKAEGGFFVAHYFILNCKCSKNTSVTPEWSCSKKQNKIKPRWGCEEGIHLLCWFLYWPVWKWKTAQGPFVGAAPSFSVSAFMFGCLWDRTWSYAAGRGHPWGWMAPCFEMFLKLGLFSPSVCPPGYSGEK